MAYFKTILSQPSTYAGLAAIAALFGKHITPEQYQAINDIAAAVFAAVAVFHKGPETPKN